MEVGLLLKLQNSQIHGGMGSYETETGKNKLTDLD